MLGSASCSGTFFKTLRRGTPEMTDVNYPPLLWMWTHN